VYLFVQIFPDIPSAMVSLLGELLAEKMDDDVLEKTLPQPARSNDAFRIYGCGKSLFV
jgi:hypothetical protein